MLLLLKDGWIGFMNVLPFHLNGFDEKNTFCSQEAAAAKEEVVATDFVWHESISNPVQHINLGRYTYFLIWWEQVSNIKSTRNQKLYSSNIAYKSVVNCILRQHTPIIVHV